MTAIGKSAPIGKIGKSAPLWKIRKSVPIGEIGKSAPVGKIGKSAPLWKIRKSVPIGEIGKSAPVGKIGKSAPIGKFQKFVIPTLEYKMIREDNKVSALVNFTDAFGLNQEVTISLGLFNQFNSCYRGLLNSGYPWPKNTDQCKKLHQTWLDSGPIDQIIGVPKPGWYFGRYLFLNTPTFINGKQYLYSSVSNNISRPMIGTRKDLLKLAENMAYSPTLVFGVSLLFGSILLPATNLPNVGIYLWSKTALDRFAYMEAITALAGGRGTIHIANKSRSEIERLARDCNDFALCSEYLLPEPKMARQLPNVFSWLASSQYRLSFTLVGEHPLSGALRHGIKELIGIPLNCDPEFGICDSLPPGCASSADLLNRVIRLAQNRSYSWVLTEFTDGITAHRNDAKSIRDKVLREMGKFMRVLKISNPVDRKFAAIFALAFAGAVIASELKLIPWSPAKIGSSIAECYRTARGETIDASIPVRLTDEDIDQLRLRLRGPTVKNLLWNGNRPCWTIAEAQNAEAFFRTEPNPAGYLVPGAVLCLWFGSEKAKLLIAWLDKQEFLIKEKNRPNTKTYGLQIHGAGTHRYYVIDPAFMNPSEIRHNPILNS
jgi:hypothetical protein